jgi:hypothetical protein
MGLSAGILPGMSVPGKLIMTYDYQKERMVIG